MSRLTRFLRRHFTLGGRLVLSALLIGAPSILNPSQTNLDILFVLAFFLLLVSLLSAQFFRPKLVCSWDIPSRVSRGDKAQLRLKITNTGPRPAHQVDVALELVPLGIKVPQDRIPRPIFIPPDHSVKRVFELQTSKRGVYKIGHLYLGTVFPFSILRLGEKVKGERELLVTPFIHPVHYMPITPGRSRQAGIDSSALERGESTDFVGVREYRHGDSLRKVHWKLLARRGIPVVKEYARESFTRIGLILDSYKPPSDEHLELAAEVAASIANYLSLENAVVDFFAEGSKVHQLGSLAKESMLGAVLTHLACLDPCTDSPYEHLREESRSLLTGLSALVVVTYEMSPEREGFLDDLRAQGVSLLVYAVGEGENDSEVTYLHPSTMPECLKVL